MELSGTRQLLFYVDYVTILGENINSSKNSTEVLSEANREDGLDMNTE
jgi:hypothetical protein